MAAKKFLVDTDIIIDYLRGGKESGRFLEKNRKAIMLAAVSQKELFGYKNLSQNEYRTIRHLLEIFPIIYPDHRVLSYYTFLYLLYSKHHLAHENADCMIAATALAKNLTLVTRNRKHFAFIEGLKLVHLP